MQTFNPSVRPSTTTDKPEFKVLESDFGDGYTRATGDGMNNIRRIVSLTWDWLTAVQADEIETFIRSHKGAQAFLYTLADSNEQLKWTCKEIQRTRTTPNKIEATFRQSFAL